MNLPLPNHPYVLDGFIASGHFGSVYRARHAYLSTRVVALKLLPARGDVDAVLDEARRAASLGDHPNVVKVHDAGLRPDGHVFIAMDLCEFGSLDDRVTDAGMDPAAACLHIANACRGLSHVHQADLLHLDLRPANIMLGDADVAKLTDFGLSRYRHLADVEDFYTPHAAPECVELGRAEVRSDIYAMAMTLGHLLTGGSYCHPFPSATQLLIDSVEGDWPRRAALGINVPPRLRKLLQRSTDYDVDKRPEDIEAFKRDLDRATPYVCRSSSMNPTG